MVESVAQHPGKWARSFLYWRDDACDCGGEVCRRSLGGGAAVAGGTAVYAERKAALRTCRPRSGAEGRGGSDCGEPRAPDCARSGRSMECGFGKGFAVCHDVVSRCGSAARKLRDR